MKEVTIQNYNRIFWNIVSKYDVKNDNILRKIIHSYSVAEKCFTVASKLKLNKKQREFCYLMGLFHDIGRFEQWKLYQTYNDKLSINHGKLGAEMLLSFLNKFNLTQRENEIVIEVTKLHEEIYQGQDKEVKFYHSIVRNCDAFANVFTTANGAQQMTVENNGVTKQILDDFLNLKPLYIYSPQTKLDRALMLTACTYYVEFDFLRREIIDKNYIDCIFDTFSQYLNDEDKKIYKKAIEVLKNKI